MAKNKPTTLRALKWRRDQLAIKYNVGVITNKALLPKDYADICAKIEAIENENRSTANMGDAQENAYFDTFCEKNNI